MSTKRGVATKMRWELQKIAGMKSRFSDRVQSKQTWNVCLIIQSARAVSNHLTASRDGASRTMHFFGICIAIVMHMEIGFALKVCLSLGWGLRRVDKHDTCMTMALAALHLQQMMNVECQLRTSWHEGVKSSQSVKRWTTEMHERNEQIRALQA